MGDYMDAFTFDELVRAGEAWKEQLWTYIEVRDPENAQMLKDRMNSLLDEIDLCSKAIPLRER